MPWVVIRASEVCKDRRFTIIDRLDDVIATIDVCMTYYLYIRCAICTATFHDNSSHILIDIGCQNSLNNKHVIIPFLRFHHTQIVHIAITIEV